MTLHVSLHVVICTSAFFSNCEQSLWQPCEEFRLSSSAESLCVPKIDYSCVLSFQVYLHIKRELLLSKFRAQSYWACTYFQPPKKKSLKTQRIFPVWTRTAVQCVPNGGEICLQNGEYVEGRGPAIVSGKATLPPCREVQFNFLCLLLAALFYLIYFHFSYLPSNFFLEVLTALWVVFFFFLPTPRFYFHLLIYTAVTQIAAFAFQGSSVISKAMGDPVICIH